MFSNGFCRKQDILIFAGIVIEIYFSAFSNWPVQPLFFAVMSGALWSYRETYAGLDLARLEPAIRTSFSINQDFSTMVNVA